MIHSVGYERRDLDSFVELLQPLGVDEVVDVRLTSRSRRPGFSRTRLTDALAGAGIAYTHVPELGNPPENREPFRAGDPAAVRRYREQLDTTGRPAVEELVAAARERTLAVLCHERDESTCHRREVIARARRLDPSLLAVPLE